MDTAPLASTVNLTRPLILLLLILLVQIRGCEEKREQRVPIGIITTTNYCQGVITSADVKVKPGYIALSRDIEKQHRLKYGDLIYLEGETEPYVFMDLMPPQWKRRADLYSRSCKDAREYGVQRRRLWFVRKK